MKLSHDGAPAPPILYWFDVTQTPAGGAPVEIREQWRGVVLAVREPRPAEAPTPFLGRDVLETHRYRMIRDGVPVTVADALQALRFYERPAAAAWWEQTLRDLGQPRLVFRIHEGQLLPSSLAPLLHPEIEDLAALL
jgi:hypothetical protein